MNGNLVKSKSQYSLISFSSSKSFYFKIDVRFERKNSKRFSRVCKLS